MPMRRLRVGDEHRRGRGHEQQRDHARLRQRHVVADQLARAVEPGDCRVRRRRAVLRLPSGRLTASALMPAPPDRAAGARDCCGHRRQPRAANSDQRDPQQRADGRGGRRSATPARRPRRSGARAAPARSAPRPSTQPSAVPASAPPAAGRAGGAGASRREQGQQQRDGDVHERAVGEVDVERLRCGRTAGTRRRRRGTRCRRPCARRPSACSAPVPCSSLADM